jgi:uncharacterized protein
MECRAGCGVCCIVLSISSPIPGMPGGKPAGVKCIHLTTDLKCGIFESIDRPWVCKQFKAEKLFCGESRLEATQILSKLEGLDITEENL